MTPTWLKRINYTTHKTAEFTDRQKGWVGNVKLSKACLCLDCGAGFENLDRCPLWIGNLALLGTVAQELEERRGGMKTCAICNQKIFISISTVRHSLALGQICVLIASTKTA